MDELSELGASRDDSTVNVDSGAGEEGGDCVWSTVSDNWYIGIGSCLVVGELDGDGGVSWCCGGSGGENGKDGSESGLHFGGWSDEEVGFKD